MSMTTMRGSPKPMRWWQSSPARLFRDLCQRPLISLLSPLCRPLRVEGVDHLPTEGGPTIFAANHSSHFDTLLVLRALPPRLRQRVVVAAAEDYFYSNPLKGAAVSLLLNAFPFKRNGNALCSLRRCEKLVANGWSLLLYPEGTRSPDGVLGTFQPGVGLLAARMGVPVVSVCVEGAHALLPKGRCLPRRGPVAIHFGRPMRYQPDAEPESVSRELRSRVLTLASGVRQPPPAHAAATPQDDKEGCYGHAV